MISRDVDGILDGIIAPSWDNHYHQFRFDRKFRVQNMSDVTRILSQIESGDLSAAEKLLPLIYDELRKLAAAKLAQEVPGQTLQATALVHEAYVRLVDVDQPQEWNNRGHFFGAAAEAMRRILVDKARRKLSQKQGGLLQRIELDSAAAIEENSGDDLMALDEALTRLEQQWPDKAKLVKLKYFAGLTIAEASQTMGISTATAERYWRFARAWLHSQLKTRD
jgi:RNA polymerase sigma factor (TIGR02999 family)